MASQTVDGSDRVQVTRCRQWAGSRIQSPSPSSRSVASPSMRSFAAPETTRTHSSVSCSYHWPSGVVCPVELDALDAQAGTLDQQIDDLVWKRPARQIARKIARFDHRLA